MKNSVIKSTSILLAINIGHYEVWDMFDFVSLENLKTRVV